MVGAFYATADEKRRAWCEGKGDKRKLAAQPEPHLPKLCPPICLLPPAQELLMLVALPRLDAQASPQHRAHAQREAEQLAAARAAAAASQVAREAEWAAQPQRVVIDTRRPWNAASSTYYMSAQVEAEARRRQQREAAEANRAAVQYKAAASAQARAAEQAALLATMVAEVRAGCVGRAEHSRAYKAFLAAPKANHQHAVQRAAPVQHAADACRPTCPTDPSSNCAGQLLQPRGRQRALDPARATHQAALRGAGTGQPRRRPLRCQAPGCRAAQAGQRRERGRPGGAPQAVTCPAQIRPLAMATGKAMGNGPLLELSRFRKLMLFPKPPLLQFAPAPPPYCCDTELESSSRSRPASACGARSELGSIASYGGPARVAAEQRPASASRRALEGQGVAAALRIDEAPAASTVAARLGSYSGGDSRAGAASVLREARPAPTRPQTAPAQRRQPATYPWTWDA